MLYSKLNILHWHLVDEDSFPLYVPEVPELSEEGRIGGVYSEVDIQMVIAYAKIRELGWFHRWILLLTLSHGAAVKNTRT